MGAGPGFPAGTGCLQPDLPAFRTGSTQLTLQLMYINDATVGINDLPHRGGFKLGGLPGR